jgi:serine protease Do
MKTRKKKKLVLLPGAVAVGLVLAGCSGGDGGQAQGGENTGSGEAQAVASAGEEGTWPVETVAQRVGPSVVQINTEAIQTTPYGTQEEARGVGSGVIYREDGHIVTNNHVVEGANEVNVAFADGSVETGEVVGTDPYTDLAVVKVDRGGLPAADFADGREPVLGQIAVAVGSPSGFQSTVTSGVVSGLNREVPASYTGGTQETSLVDLIQTDAAISPGSSGGALANRNGEVMGINVAYLPPAETGAVGIGFAIPSDTAVDVAEGLIETGEATQPYLGVSLTDLTPEISERFGARVESGALVTGVDPEGPAAEAGIRTSDVITAVGEGEVASTGDLLSALRGRLPGETVEVTAVGDGGEPREVTIELGERNPEPPEIGEQG